MIKPGQWCLVMGPKIHPPENLGKVVQAIRPEAPPSYKHSCWKISQPLLWTYHLGPSPVRMPYCPTKYLHPLPDIEPESITEQKPLDIPLKQG